MEPFEVMVSESQERMLAWSSPARLDEVLAVCGKWETGATAIGEVTDSGRLRVLRRRASWSATCRSRRWSTSARSTTSSPRSRRTAGSTAAAGATLEPTRRRRGDRCSRCSRSPNIASSAGRSSSTTRSSARAPCGGPSRPTPRCCSSPGGRARAIAVSIDGNGRRVACDPYAGAVEAVLECAANLACVGAEPLGLTNCLNFGNPEKPARRLAARPRRRGPGRRLRRARRPGRRRQRLALQRGTRGPDLPDAGRRHGRRAARRRAAPPASRSAPRGRRDRAARAVRPVARRLGAGEAARRARAGPAAPSTSARSRAAIELVRDAVRAGGRRTAPTTSARAASPARSPSARSRGGVGCRGRPRRR